jgi:uncharacterized membrane protein
MAKNPVSPKRWLLQGVIISLPIVITLLVLIVVLDFILGILSPVVAAVAYVWPNEPSALVIQGTMVLALVIFFLLIGLIADITPGKHVSQLVDRAMATIPGLSTVYTSVRRVSDILVDDDTDQFQDVLLIEFPHEDAYMLSFLVGESPREIEDSLAIGEMVTVMLPLGPNPTTNGFIMHMPEEHVHEVDLTVEEAIQSIATLGVAEVSMDDH